MLFKTKDITILKIKFFNIHKPQYIYPTLYIGQFIIVALLCFVIDISQAKAEIKIDQINNGQQESSQQNNSQADDSLTITSLNGQENPLIDKTLPTNIPIKNKDNWQYGVSLDLGFKFLIKDSAIDDHNKSILSEIFYINNLNKLKNEPSYISGIRLGYCHEFKRIQFILSSNLASVNSNLLKKIINQSDSKLSFLYGVSFGYRFNSVLAIRSNFLTSLNQKTNLNYDGRKNALNNVSLSLSLNI